MINHRDIVSLIGREVILDIGEIKMGGANHLANKKVFIRKLTKSGKVLISDEMQKLTHTCSCRYLTLKQTEN